MEQNERHGQTLVDFVTGKEVPDIGSEANRQAVERVLVEKKGFSKKDIEVNVPITLELAGETYRSRVDLMVCVEGKRMLAVKCAAGSLGSREREILAAARISDTYQIPYAMVSDGKTALLFDTVSGKKIGEGLQQVPSKQTMSAYYRQTEFIPFPKERLAREKLIFRSYDSMNVNRI
jgi:hypothetical protein